MTEKPSLLRLAKGEWRWPLAIAVLIMALTCLPYFFGWFITPPGYQYGGSLYNTPDQNVYLAYMRQAHDGKFIFTDQFTTEPQRPWFFHVLFLKMGIVSRLSGLSLILTYHLARIISGILLLLALYLLAARFLESVWARRFFLLFIAFSSGLGWLYFALFNPTGNQPHPPDFGPGVIMPELITFMSLLLNPLFCAAALLLVAVWLLLLIALERRSVGWALLAGAAAMFLGNIHTYDSIPVALTILLFLAGRGLMQRRIPWRELAFAVIIGVMMLPPVLYQLYLYRDLPVFRLKAEVATLSPPLVQYLLALGLPLLLAVPGIWIALKQSKKQFDFVLPVVWFAATLACAYLPFPFQRKMAEGMQIPVCLLAALCISQRLYEKRQGWQPTALAAALLLLCFPSNAFFLNGRIHALESFSDEKHYLQNDEVKALDWLDKHVSPEDAIMSSPMLGEYIPSRTGAKTYVSHWAETLNYGGKLKLLANFLSGRMANTERINLLRTERIRYIILGPEEQSFVELFARRGVDLDGLPIKEVWREKTIAIYEIR